MPRDDPSYGAHLTAGAAPLLVGLGIATSGLLVAYPPLISQGARYLIGAVVLVIVLRRRALPLQRHLPARMLLLLVVDTVVGLGLFSVATIEALRHGTAAGVGVVVGLAPLVIAAGTALASRRGIPRALITGTVIATMGAIVVNGAGSLAPAGLAWAVVALASDATFTLVSAPLLRVLEPGELTTVSAAAAGIGLVAIGLITGGVPPAPTVTETAADVAIALAVTVGAFVLWFRGIHRLGVARAAPYVALIPVGALVGSPSTPHRSVLDHSSASRSSRSGSRWRSGRARQVSAAERPAWTSSGRAGLLRSPPVLRAAAPQPPPRRACVAPPGRRPRPRGRRRRSSPPADRGILERSGRSP